MTTSDCNGKTKIAKWARRLSFRRILAIYKTDTVRISAIYGHDMGYHVIDTGERYRRYEIVMGEIREDIRCTLERSEVDKKKNDILLTLPEKTKRLIL